MFIEGCVSKGYLQALRAANYDIQLTVESTEEAGKYINDNCDLPDPADHDYTTDPWVRIYIDCDIEDFIPPKTLIEYVQKAGNLPLLLGNPDPDILREVECSLNPE